MAVLETEAMKARPARIKAIPPTISRFQEIINMAVRTNDGMLCIKNAATVPQKPSPVSKTSNENNDKKSMNIIERIRGVQ